MPSEEGPPSCEVLAALVASLRQELAETVGALEQARAGAGQADAEAAIAAEEKRP